MKTNHRGGRLLAAALLASLLFVVSCTVKRGSDDSVAERSHAKLETSSRLYDLGDYSAALDTAQSLLSMENGEKGSQVPLGDRIQCRLVIGNIHISYGNYARAMKFYEDGVKLCDNAHLDTLVKFYHNMSVTACYLNDSLRAREYIEKSTMNAARDSLKSHYNWLVSRAFYEKTFGSPRKAMLLNKEAARFVDENRMDSVLMISPITEIMAIYESENQLDSVLRYLDRYAFLSNWMNVPGLVIDAERLYMRIYTKKGDINNALRHQDRYFALKDSLMNTETMYVLSERYNREVEETSNSRIQNLEIEISYQKAWLISIIILVAVAALLFIFHSQRQKLRKAYRMLYRRNRELAMAERKQAAQSVPASEKEEKEENNERLRQAIEKVMMESDEFLNPDFSVHRLAELVDSNVKYVSGFINDHYGKNFRSFINEYRVKVACERLSNPDEWGHLTMQAIAESVGIKSSTNFIASFKKEVGLTPSQYRKMARKEEED